MNWLDKVKAFLCIDIAQKARDLPDEDAASEQIEKRAIKDVMMEHLVNAEASYPSKRGVGASYHKKIK